MLPFFLFYLGEIMTSLFRQFRTDASLEKVGIILEYGQTASGANIGIRIARAGGANDAYTKALEAKVKPYRRQIQTETVDRKLLERLMREVYAETVVLGWENVEEEDGTPIMFSRAACLDLFERLPDLYQDIQEQANKSVLFRAEVMEAEAKN